MPATPELRAYRASISEADFTASVMAEALAAGWRVYHLPDWVWRVLLRAWREGGSRRGYVWPDKGFPDLILVRPPELLVIELKTTGGRVTPAQHDWLEAFAACGIETHIWRPKALVQIRARLAGRVPQ